MNKQPKLNGWRYPMTEVRGVNPDSDSPHWVELRYWKGQYAAEKERADKLQVELSEYTESHWKAFDREKKLREAVESLIDDGLLMIPEGENRAMDLLESLYPLEKEEEAK